MTSSYALRTGSESQAPNGETDVDLNSASEEQLAEIPSVGPEKAQVLVRHRPFDSWTELRRLPGFSAGLIDDLKNSGAWLGAVS